MAEKRHGRKPPIRKSVLKEIVLSHIRWYESRTITDLTHIVANDYGSVTERSIYRNVAKLRDEGIIVRVVDDEGDPGYIRAQPPRWDSREQVYV